jgi:hypothetical protein
MPNAQCPMPNALYQIVPHVTEKDYNLAPITNELAGATADNLQLPAWELEVESEPEPSG